MAESWTNETERRMAYVAREKQRQEDEEAGRLLRDLPDAIVTTADGARLVRVALSDYPTTLAALQALAEAVDRG